ncbi:MAG: hypothetical protein ABIO85_00840 [Sphingomicrobium sp.]
MADHDLPEGTDTIVSDAEMAGSDLTPTPTADPATSGGKTSGVRDALKGGTDKLKSSASDKAYGFLGQGIERSSAGLTNVSALIGDTAASIDERLGSQYGDYARQAADAVERAASGLSNKNPEDLVDDVRGLVRKSPGIALAGAAILGFALVRVVKSGLETADSKSRSSKS